MAEYANLYRRGVEGGLRTAIAVLETIPPRDFDKNEVLRLLNVILTTATEEDKASGV